MYVLHGRNFGTLPSLFVTDVQYRIHLASDTSITFWYPSPPSQCGRHLSLARSLTARSRSNSAHCIYIFPTDLPSKVCVRLRRVAMAAPGGEREGSAGLNATMLLLFSPLHSSMNRAFRTYKICPRLQEELELTASWAVTAYSGWEIQTT